MPEHSTHGVNLDRAGAVNDNRAAVKKRATQTGGKKDGVVHGAGKGVPKEHTPSHAPVATSMLGSHSILDLAHHMKGDKRPGIPGILHTTTTGNEIRGKLLSGIIDMHEHGRKGDGPVHSVTGHDATAMNAGMRPLPGAVIHR